MTERPGAADYLRTLKSTIPTMVAQIKELAEAEITPAAKHGGIGAGLFGGAGAFGYIALKLLGLSACFAISMFFFYVVHLDVIPALAAGFALVGLIFVIITAILALLGKGQMKFVKAPEATIAETKASIQALSDALTVGTQNAEEGNYPVEGARVVADPRFAEPESPELPRY